MATYLELKQQAEQLMAQAEELREKETRDAIADIQAKMKAYGLTARDIGLESAPGKRAPRGTSSGAKPAARYRGPAGETWSGRGRKPQWVVQALKDGKKLADLAA